MKKMTLRAFYTLLIFVTGGMLLGLSGVEKTDRRTEVEVMKRLGTYVGKWKSDTKTNRQDGTDFYYTYELAHYDQAQNIFKMTISRHSENGSKALLWEGYKGWDFARKEVYYFAFSPSGRFSRGTVYLEGEKLITEYDGYGADGSQAEILDDFYPVRNDTFKSVTNLRPEDGDWRVIGRDQWTRMGNGDG